MSQSFINIQAVSENIKDKVKQDLKFRTGKFVWRVKFNIPLDPSTVNNVNLHVTTSNQVPIQTAIHYNTIENEIEIEPLEAYSESEVYFLNITTNVKSEGGRNLKQPIQIQFTCN